MRTARQISAQARNNKVKKSLVVEPIIVTKLVVPNERIAERMMKANIEAIDNPVISPNDLLCTDGLHIPVIVPNSDIPYHIYIPGFFKDNIEDGYYIINANGYTKEQLSTELPDEDVDYIEDNGYVKLNGKIPANFGMGVEFLHKNDRLIYKRGGNSWRAVPTVTLEISTWRGVSCGAMHYYGKLAICMPEATHIGTEKQNWTTSTYIPMYKRNDIELTQILEQWEIEKYPENYRDYYHAGQRHRGFYTKKQVTDYAKQVFEQIFAEGWKFRIDDHS